VGAVHEFPLLEFSPFGGAGCFVDLFGGTRLSCPVIEEWMIERRTADLTSRSLRERSLRAESHPSNQLAEAHTPLPDRRQSENGSAANRVRAPQRCPQGELHAGTKKLGRATGNPLLLFCFCELWLVETSNSRYSGVSQPRSRASAAARLSPRARVRTCPLISRFTSRTPILRTRPRTSPTSNVSFSPNRSVLFSVRM